MESQPNDTVRDILVRRLTRRATAGSVTGSRAAAVKRHPDLRTRVASSSLDVTSLRGSGVGRPQEAVDLLEPVAAVVDVDDVYVVQQAVEDRGGEDLVAGEDLGPVAHVLVGGEGDRALLVARAHQAEEEVGLLAVEGPEAHFVDDEQRAVQVAPGLEPSGRDRRVSLEHVHEVIEEEVGGAEPVLDGLHAEGHGEVALADAGRAHEEHVVDLARQGARGQGLERRPVCCE